MIGKIFRMGRSLFEVIGVKGGGSEMKAVVRDQKGEVKSISRKDLEDNYTEVERI